MLNHLISKATIYDVELQAGKSITLPTKTEDNVFIFLIEGNAIIDGTNIPEKTAVLFSEGDEISVSSESDKQLRFMFCSAKPLKEPVSWGGPIVMNTREELNEAFKELDKGTTYSELAEKMGVSRTTLFRFMKTMY